jgi:hypothetical protein
MNPVLLNWIGYIASAIVLISLLMKSVIRLRWINLVGALVFTIYGFLINALPVGIMNSGIVMINIYYLYQMYAKKDFFTLLESTNDTNYFNYFMQFHENNIVKFMDLPKDLNNENHIKLYVLRNTVPAAVLVFKTINQNTLEVLIDYATPTYRDFKTGLFVYEKQKDFFLEKGYEKLISHCTSQKHKKYLLRMGFVPIAKKGIEIYEKSIKKI